MQVIVPVAESLVAPALHDVSPVQVAVQLSPWHCTPLAQLLAPEQVTFESFPPPAILSLQLSLPMHWTVQLCGPPPH